MSHTLRALTSNPSMKKKVNKIKTGGLRVWLVAEHLQDPGFPPQNLRNKQIKSKTTEFL